MYDSISTRNTHFLNIVIKFPMSFSDLATVCSKRSGLLAVARLLPGFAAWNRRAWRAFIRKAVGGVIALRWKTEAKKKRVQKGSKEFKVQSQIFKKRERKRTELKSWNVREVFRHLRSLCLLPLIRRRNLQCLSQVGDVNGGAIKCYQMLSKVIMCSFYEFDLRLGDRVPSPWENHEGWDLSGTNHDNFSFFQLFFEENSGKKQLQMDFGFRSDFWLTNCKGFEISRKVVGYFWRWFGLTFLTPIRRPKVKSNLITNFAAVWDGEILECGFPFRLLTESSVQVRSQALNRADAIGLPQGIEQIC